MDAPFVYTAIFALLAGIVVQHLNIRLAHRFGWLDIPTARRRHVKSTPITGGVGVFFAWFLTMLFYNKLDPGWMSQYGKSFLVMGGSIIILIALGLVDDLRGLSPSWKLSVEFGLAAFVIAYEPQVHEICKHWETTLGVFVWPMAMVWIVGITNSINLIDGLDGLAGGMSVLVGLSITILSMWTGEQAQFATVTMLALVGATLGFLRYNWSPAKIFLGDNGSLPLGFIIATSSLMCRPQTKSWIMIASVILMLGYPILDMGLAVLRRYKKHLPLFKADRNHLHHRIQRLGLPVSHTAAMLLSIGMYLQIASLCINLISQPSAIFGITVVCFSIFTLLHLVRSIERWRVKRIFYTLESRKAQAESHRAATAHTIMHIELETLLEAAMFEEQSRFQRLVEALELMVSSMIRPQDIVFKTNQRVSVVFTVNSGSVEQVEEIESRFQEGIAQFLSLYNLQCSLASIPITFEQVDVVQTGGKLAIIASNAETKKAA